MVDALAPPGDVVSPPSEDWFDAAADMDLGPLGESLGLGRALGTADLDPENWTQQVLELVAAPLARSRACMVLGSQLGVVTVWDPHPDDYWAEVDRVVRLVTAHVHGAVDEDEA